MFYKYVVEFYDEEELDDNTAHGLVYGENMAEAAQKVLNYYDTVFHIEIEESDFDLVYELEEED